LTQTYNYYKADPVTFWNSVIEVNMNLVMIKILQGSVVTQTVLGVLT